MVQIYLYVSYSRYVGFYTFLKPTLMIKNLNLIKEVAIKSFDNFTDHQMYIPEELEPIFTKNLICLQGNSSLLTT